MSVNSTTLERTIAIQSNGHKTIFDWHPVDNHPIDRLSSCDLNTLNSSIYSGYWLIDSTQVYDNSPISVGILNNIYTATNICMQIAYSWNGFKVYKRRKLGNNAWEEWQQLQAETIITDKSGYLESTNNTADRTQDILNKLNSKGVCNLGPGVFYIKNLNMPNDTSIIGQGKATKVILLGTDEAAYAIKMGSFCTVKDLYLSGSANPISHPTYNGGRDGILWSGNYDESRSSTDQPQQGTLDNLYIENFTGGGVTCHNTGYGTINYINATNLHITRCYAGINIDYWSEFHKFTNCRCYLCYIGCVNNGGNNMFVNCDFSGNREIAMLMDNSQDQSPNNTHGSAIGCVFNHTLHNGVSNAGTGIQILNCGSGFIFTGCQIFFSKIDLQNSDGICIANCNFGYSNCDIHVSGGNGILFNGNIHQNKPPITIENNADVHFINCYNRTDGTIIKP